MHAAPAAEAQAPRLHQASLASGKTRDISGKVSEEYVKIFYKIFEDLQEKTILFEETIS